MPVFNIDQEGEENSVKIEDDFLEILNSIDAFIEILKSIDESLELLSTLSELVSKIVEVEK